MTTQTQTVSTPLTRDEVKAIKQATAVVFFHDATTGKGIMRLTKETKDPTYGSTYDATMEIPIYTSIIGKSNGADYASQVITSAQYAEVWRSVASLLKTGDKVSVEFQANYLRPYAGYEDVNLDTVVFKINRDGTILQFIIDAAMSREGYFLRTIRHKRQHDGF